MQLGLPCVVCFSATDPVARDSVNAGIFVLLAVTAAVLGGFAAFIARLVWRSRRHGVVTGAAVDLERGPS